MAQAKQASDLPGGTVTFLLTDVAGSTRLWEAHPQAMEQALARHDRIVSEAVAAHRGKLLKHKGEGDSTFSVFTRASDAAAAAVACQRALASEAWPDGVELRVRIAVHTGEAELRDGDYFGPAVNRTARLRGIAHGGQMVLSQATADLVRDGLPDRAALHDLGIHRLPDLGRPEIVYGLTHPDLSSTFPPLRSLDAFPGNLPIQLTSFVGRERESKLVADGLRSARLVTLTGTGGVGKTRLAIHTAADMVADYPDGAWLCELAAVADPASMLQVIAASLGLAPGSGALQPADIPEFIGTRRLLMVLDNCEHLLDATAGLVETVLARCPSVRVLATSREALDVPGERVIRLRSLALPEADAGLEEVARVEATRLFLERAAAVGSKLEASDAAAIMEICRRLDGIPLAIELAAARVMALSPAEIAGLLDERFRLLTGGRRAALERHHTLRAAVDWSYSLLSDTERPVFDRLGVFPATFDAAAAQAVAGEAMETWDVIDALSSLVAKSMLVADRTASGSTRYQMLETLRHYARERLDQEGTADACRRRHAQYYADFARRARRGTRSEDDLLWWSRMRTEIDNLRAATLWALDSRVHEDSDLALRIIADLTAGSFEEWAGVFAWAEQAVERAERAAPALRSAVLGAASMSAFYRTDYVVAHRLARDALRNAILADSPSPELPYMGLMLSSRPERIRGILAVGLAALDTVSADLLSRARLHAAAAGSTAQTGDLQFAAAEANETLRIGHQLSHRFFIMVGLYLVALTSWRTASDDALAALEECIALGESFSANWRGRALALAAQLRAGKGDDAGGISALRQAITETHSSGERTGVATAFDRGIQVLASTGRYELAAVLGGVVTKGGVRRHPRRAGPRAARSSTRT